MHCKDLEPWVGFHPPSLLSGGGGGCPTERPHPDVTPMEPCLRVTDPPGRTHLYRQSVRRTGIYPLIWEGHSSVTVGAILLGQRPKCRQFLHLGFPITSPRLFGWHGEQYVPKMGTFPVSQPIFSTSEKGPSLDGNISGSSRPFELILEPFSLVAPRPWA